MKKAKQIICILLVLALLAAFLPTALVLPVRAAVIESGDCADGIRYTLTDDGVLTFSGKGVKLGYDGFVQYEETNGEYRNDYNQPIGNWYKIEALAKKNLFHVVKIEAPVRTLENRAFYGFSCLNAITLPDTLTTISEQAFSGCTGLTEIVVPDSVTGIAMRAFEGCSGLTYMRLPFIGGGTKTTYYNGRYMLGYIFGYTDKGHSFIFGEEGDNIVGVVPAKKAGYISQASCEWVEESEPYVFSFFIPASLKTVEISYGAKYIGENAFDGCTNLTSVVIPASVKWGKIGENAFRGCDNVTIHTQRGSDAQRWAVDNGIPYSNDVVRGVCETDFQEGECISLITWEINEDGVLVFSGEGNVLGFGSINYVNYGPDGIGYEISDDLDTWYAIKWLAEHNRFTSIEIQAPITKITAYAFEDFACLTSIMIPNSVSVIGYHAFTDSGLKDIYYYGSEASWNEIIENPDNLSLSDPGVPDGCVIHFGLGLPGCSEGDHTWDTGTVITAATCGKKGEKTYKCTVCGTTKTEEIPATGKHLWDTGKVIKAATCGEKGEKLYICAVCKTRKTEEIPATGKHAWGAGKVTKEATCGEKGEKTYTCTVCKTRKTEEIPATGKHTWGAGKVTKEATCTEKGIKTFTCAVCQETKTEPIAANGHTVVTDKAVAATCTTDGKTEGSHCSVCNAVIKAQETVKATGHAYGAWTKLNDIQHQRVCANDKAHIEKADHTWDAGKVTKPATAEAEGEKTYTCSVCKATKTEPIAKLEPSAPEYTPGDVDGDGTITPADARLALRASVGLEPNIVKGTAAYKIADADGDDTLTPGDARLILRASVGLEDASKFGKR